MSDIPPPTDDDFFSVGSGLPPMPAEGVAALSNLIEFSTAKRSKPKRKTAAASDLEFSAEAIARHPAWTNVDLALEFTRRRGADLLHASDADDWLSWTGTHWQQHAVKLAELTAERFVQTMIEEAKAAPAPEQGEEEIKATTVANLQARLSHHHNVEMCSLSRKYPEIATTTADLNKNHGLLSVANGTIDLRTGALREHRREDLATFITDIPYLPDASCDAWEAFLDHAFYGDDERIDFLHRLVGYTLTGETKEQKFFFLHGDGGRGKSTFLDTIARLLGHHAVSVPASFIELLRNEEHPASLASTFGKRMVTTSETREGRVMDEVRVKQFTGEDTITARHMYKGFFEFKPVGKLFIAGNHKPVITGVDEGIWRRMVLVEFDRAVSPAQRAENLKDRLQAELPGILAWAVRGAQRWYERGLDLPAQIIEASAAYRVEQDVFGQFIRECCEVGDGATHRYLSGDFRGDYESWCKRNGATPYGARMVGQRLKAYGVESKPIWFGGQTKQAWVGISKLTT